MRKLLAAFLTLAFVGSASAQNLQNLPPNTVLGRLGAGVPGPAQAIPFTTLSVQLGTGGSGGGAGVSNVTRAQIPTLAIGANAYITVNGYRTANDLGYGATYTSVNANCSNNIFGAQSAAWIKDVNGICFALVTNNSNPNPNIYGTFFNGTQVNMGWFGCYGDNGNETITSADIAANPQWRGQYIPANQPTTTPYAVGTTWDAVCAQEALYAAFAQNSGPGHVSWNPHSNYQNSGFYVPPGVYDINIQLYAIMSGFTWKQEGRGGSNAVFTWGGAANTSMFLFDSASYGTFENFSIVCGVPNAFTNNTAPQPNDTACAEFDHSANSQGGLHTQQLTFINPTVQVFRGGMGISFQPSGGNQQADTVTFINPLFVGDSISSFYAVEINGANALQFSFIGGDCQGFVHDCIKNNGGQYSAYNFHQENENTCQVFTPCLNQINTTGASLHSFNGNGGDNTNLLMSIRDESTVIARGENSNQSDIYNAITTDASNFGWFANYNGYTPGMQVMGGTLNRKFMLVETGGACEQWCATTGGFGTQVLQDSAASYTVNQWAGFSIQLRFASNGFTTHCTITSNTANTITLPNSCSFSSQDSYMITGASANPGPPSWDSAAQGYRYDGDFTQAANGVNTYAGTNCVGVSGITNHATINVGDYLILPYAGRLTAGAASTWGLPVFAKVTAGPVGSPCPGQVNGTSVTIDKQAQASIDFGIWNLTVYGCTPVADGTQGMKWCQIPYNALYGVKAARNVTLNNGYLGGPINNATIDGFTTGSADHVIDNLIQNGNIQPFSFGQPLYNLKTGQTNELVCVLTPAATIDISAASGCNIDSSVFQLTPTANTTINATTAPQLSTFYSKYMRLLIAGTAFTTTFGTNFNSLGPIPANGPGYTAVDFMSYNGAWQEVGRSLESGGRLLQVAIGSLPTCNAASLGMLAMVTNGVASPTYNSAVSATGAVNNLVFCNGSGWTYH